MTALKGLLEALVLVVIAAAVAAVVAGIWVAVGDGTFVSRLGICLVGAGALVAVSGGLGFTQMGSADAFAWFGRGPERGPADDGGRVLTGVGVFLFVTLPLVVAGGFLATL
ncbi:hypothetical protein RB614_11145 [Phytohabitans sp. ZYX-F-186]|uniref:Major facilitator superfamily (MFS) profile domain-containing protein n=1 Tax=Phytohabitans maris TaxID=3071409 RepID=A0ABU0ZGL0_9ACTN|nr:hypothetical protein [Phytohabitans sp. ZYX-F-186]MDQ7905077.1 hypothetical protein [Phytohabitans sp. ZYX-F-186]